MLFNERCTSYEGGDLQQRPDLAEGDFPLLNDEAEDPLGRQEGNGILAMRQPGPIHIELGFCLTRYLVEVDLVFGQQELDVFSVSIDLVQLIRYRKLPSRSVSTAFLLGQLLLQGFFVRFGEAFEFIEQFEMVMEVPTDCLVAGALIQSFP